MVVAVLLGAVQPEAADTVGVEVLPLYHPLDHHPDWLQTTGNNHGTWLGPLITDRPLQALNPHGLANKCISLLG